MAYLRSIEGAYPQAIEIYKTSLDFEDSPATRADLALTEAQAGRYDEAIELAQQVRVSDPASLKADRVLASAYAQKGEYAKAVDSFTRVANAQPSIESYYALANCLLQTGKPEDKAHAQAIFDQMVKTAGESGSLHVPLWPRLPRRQRYAVRSARISEGCGNRSTYSARALLLRLGRAGTERVEDHPGSED